MGTHLIGFFEGIELWEAALLLFLLGVLALLTAGKRRVRRKGLRAPYERRENIGEEEAVTADASLGTLTDWSERFDKDSDTGRSRQ